jgi:hypothetical protein
MQCSASALTNQARFLLFGKYTSELFDAQSFQFQEYPDLAQGCIINAVRECRCNATTVVTKKVCDLTII